MSMDVRVLPLLDDCIAQAAARLAASKVEAVPIDGAENKVLVRAGTRTADEKLRSGLVLFPVVRDNGYYVVCIDQPQA
ncbi:hypothetical protein [Opitutus sp. ER46]|uniref:hypothetical protein n=1 Tax=Opitutus sp. ER46 TaxID=2161864 RepID=UPI000D324FFB|nr:hypothetical protein [Opitutus sp. ER46]PTX94196.1 hypothetical protein DB354_10540 [Opitutus sp. ER46]